MSFQALAAAFLTCYGQTIMFGLKFDYRKELDTLTGLNTLGFHWMMRRLQCGEPFVYCLQ